MMTREDVLAVCRQKPTVQEVQVPGWPSPALIRVMSPVDRDSFEAGNYLTDLSGSKTKVTYSTANIRARLVVRCLCDADGERLFKDGEAVILGAMRGMAVAIDAIYDAARELNVLTTKAEEDAAKNLDAGESSSSGSDSPAI